MTDLDAMFDRDYCVAVGRLARWCESWAGTPFKWNRCERHKGIDCLRFVLKGWSEAGWIQWKEDWLPDDTSRWGLEHYLTYLTGNFHVRTVPFDAGFRPGDLMFLATRYLGTPSVGFLFAYRSWICYAREGIAWAPNNSIHKRIVRVLRLVAPGWKGVEG